MEVSEIIKSLKLLIDKGTKVSDIEKEIGMPANNLSSILKEKRVLPKKWIQPLENFIENGKRKKVVLIEDENGNFICDGKRVKLIWADESITDKPIYKKPLEEKDCYDSKKVDNLRHDEVGQWEEPKIDNAEIKKQIEAILAEKLPDGRNTPLGRKSWRKEQDNRIYELKSQLINQ